MKLRTCSRREFLGMTAMGIVAVTALPRRSSAAIATASEQRAAWVDALDESRSALKPTLRELLARRTSLETGDFLSPCRRGPS